MRILGIDPGPKESAFCVWDGKRIIASGKWENENVRNLIVFGVDSLNKHSNAICAVENFQSFGMGVGREVFETCYWIGEFRNECKHTGMVYTPVMRLDVKQHFCHTARATDSNIRFALEDRFGKKGTKKAPGIMYPLVGSDMRSAFAIAVMVYDTLLHQDDL